MAQQLELPNYGELPHAVLFHRDDMMSPIVVLQIPNETETDSSTYELDLQNDEHSSWLDCLKNSRRLRAYLDMEQHIVFYPDEGYFESVEDLDSQTPEQEFLMRAREHYESRANTHHDRWESMARRRTVMGVSRLRTYLGDRRGMI